jgi:hypothetical protein
MTFLSDSQILDMRIAAHNMNDMVARIVADRDELRFHSLCDKSLAHDLVPFICGSIRARMNEDKAAFEWMMFCLARFKGHEDILCQFWIANWQIRINGAPKLTDRIED